jgi:hypothetical protein
MAGKSKDKQTHLSELLPKKMNTPEEDELLPKK